jgi:AraC family transcriptional regulator
MRAVLSHVEDGLRGQISVAELARLARLSSAQFSRRFKRLLGISPGQYIIARRIQRAQLLMLETTDSLAHIAAECGFSDQSHLTRTFYRRMQMGPARWRRLNRDSNRLGLPANGPELPQPSLDHRGGEPNG